ncbi:precorrin-2 dehydrogenase/sirohydrochlorin ferrochelatase family protein [Macrococcus armenti]|uniref:precorrin-2 dehydrogenase/sirohydrochlorin ferrochelatase family protein n=1 Tax=Macrococcus armenti TaxID=2875764 RepID=UPI001CCB1E3A|nr:bifunctional precorrin-2 dehydrogenase/sirohydrochlorin ferrochelatase [Macrococcus armenti]UBH14635.1 bifunctional precorrin-2 dehydrogenase/sirohydrochlorin ferrochelatase [Macrococcus armenti]UBH16995.1 bifunctional precorrin-2 dehydrogenase/sirohydrochlorin ferrochelatase [Macrococcus armenti]UBH19259.1 bifunctional precorrin-2 dehydrogenase/sirohydrochlorin ferrochelatase [Macrococcus armenti]
MYPVMLDINEKNILIVGGGQVATRKVQGLMNEGANVTVIAPEVTDVIKQSDVTIVQQPFKHQDISAFNIVFIATNDKAVNDAVMERIEKHQLVNDCTNQQRSNFFNMASLIYGEMRIMISTEGSNPIKSKNFKNKLKEILNKEQIK